MKSYVLAPQWEPLSFADGSLVLNNYFGKHLKIQTPPPGLMSALETLAHPTALERVTSSPDVKKYLDFFVKKGILRNDSPADWPEFDQLRGRFYPFLSWLAQFDLPTRPSESLRAFRRLRQARVAVIGLGGTGTHVAMMLAAIGVGHLRLIDGDQVELSNLVRQTYYDESDLGRLKTEALQARLRRFTSHTEVETHPLFIESTADAQTVVQGCDFVVLCADAPRILINRWVDLACRANQIPYIGAFAGAVGPLCKHNLFCFACVEEHLRVKMGDGHDHMVQALQKTRRRQYPSFVANVLRTAEFQFYDTVAHLTGLFPPRAEKGILRFDRAGSVQVEEMEQRCPQCSGGVTE